MADSASSTSAVDAVIDKWGGQLDAEDRDAIADEVAYQYYSALREQVGDKADAATLADINALASIPQQEKDAAFQQSNRVMRKILRPLGYKLLQLHGLDPATASPEAAQAALDAPLTPQQQQEIGRKLEELYESVYEPEIKAVMAETGLDAQDPEATWREFQLEVQQRQQPQRQQQQDVVKVAVPSAIAGAVVALLVSRVFSWLKQRRQRRRQDAPDANEMSESDSLQDAASAYAD